MATSVDIPDGLEQGIEAELAKGTYTSKSELIRDAIRRLLEEDGMIGERRLSKQAREGIDAARKSNTTVPHEDVVSD